MPPGNHPTKARDGKNRTSASQPRRSRPARSSTPDSAKSLAASRSRKNVPSTTNTTSTRRQSRTAEDSSASFVSASSKLPDRRSKEQHRKSRQQRPPAADSSASVVSGSSKLPDRRSKEAQRKSRHRSRQRSPTPVEGKNTRTGKSIDHPSKQSDQQQPARSIKSSTTKITPQPPKIHDDRRTSRQNQSTSTDASRQSDVRSKASHGSRKHRSSTPSTNHDNRDRRRYWGAATDQPRKLSRQSSNASVESRPQDSQSAETRTPTKSNTDTNKSRRPSNVRSSKRHERTIDHSRKQSASPRPSADRLPFQRHRRSTEQLVSTDCTDSSTTGFSHSGSSLTGTGTQSRSKTERFQSTQRSEGRSQRPSTTSSNGQQWPRWTQRDLDTIVSVLSDNKQDDPRQKAIRWIDAHRDRLHSHPRAVANLSCALDDVEMDRQLARAALRHLVSRKLISDEESRTISVNVTAYITFGDLAQLLRRHAAVFKRPRH